MSDSETPQLYLLTPPVFEPESFGDTLARLLDAEPVACIRLAHAGQDEGQIARAADHLREIAHARDVPLVIAEHPGLVTRLGLDGVHLNDGAKGVRAARKALGPDPILGSFCGTSRHAGLLAGEAGADYVAFGPVGETALGDGQQAPQDLFAWWSEMIEVPLVAEGALGLGEIARLAPVTDFFAIGPEIWPAEDPLMALQALLAPLR